MLCTRFSRIVLAYVALHSSAWAQVNQVLPDPIPAPAGVSDPEVAVVAFDGSTLLATLETGVHVALSNAGSWQFTDELVPAQASSTFGGSLAVEGALAVVGAYAADRVHVFEFDGSSWAESAVLTAPDSMPGDPGCLPGDGFGYYTAIDAGLIFVGALCGDALDGQASNIGLIHVFEPTGGSWSIRQTVEGLGSLGSHFSIDGVPGERTLAALDRLQASTVKVLRVFREVGSTFVEEALLTPSSTFAEFYGRSDLDGNTLVIGGQLSAFGPNPEGGIVFERQGTTWTQAARLKTPLATEFGYWAFVSAGQIWLTAQEGATRYLREPGGEWSAREVWSHPDFTAWPKATAGDSVIFTGSGGVVVLPTALATPLGDTYCHGDASSCPCGASQYPGGPGCRGSETLAGGLLLGYQSASVAANDLTLPAYGLAPNKTALLVFGTQAASLPFGNGLLCVGGQIRRTEIRQADAAGFAEWGPGLADAGGLIQAGDNRYFQVWFREQAGLFCSEPFNLTNGLQLTFTP